MDGNQFEKALAKAQSLMLDEGFNARVEASARAYRGSSGTGSGISSAEMALFEQQAFGGRSSTEKPVQLIETNNYESNLNKLPDAVRESFAKLPPQSDKTPVSTAAEKLSKNLMLEEQKPMRVQQTSQMSIPQVGSVDYSLIKMIVKECMKESLSELKGSLLTESASPMFKGMRISDGNKIQFLDSKGNLYEGVLKLKKKAQG